jgi:hypothetical protein
MTTHKFKIGDMVEYQGFLAIVIDTPDPNVVELDWINAPDYFEDFQLAMMIKPVD